MAKKKRKVSAKKRSTTKAKVSSGKRRKAVGKKNKKRTKKKAAKRSKRQTKREEVLQIAVTFKCKSERPGPTKFSGRLNQEILSEFEPDPMVKQEALAELQKRGFTVTGVGDMSASIRGSKELFEETFGTKLTRFTVDKYDGLNDRYVADSFYFPADGAPWNPVERVSDVIDDAYIQWPHIYMNQLFPADAPSPIPPQVDYHHLCVPGDVVSLMNAAPVHRRGGTGAGVTVAMIDSGFALGHQYFERAAYNTSVVLAPGATDTHEDGNGHGTAECANLLAIAPGINFVGVKLDNEQDPDKGATILEGFHEALQHSPDIISVSMGYDLTVHKDPNRTHLINLPNSLVALEAEIEAAVANGITVVFSAGNGQVAFPGMMPDVVSAGGVFVDANGAMMASDYASGFTSRIYSGRQVPDVSGLVGMQNNGAAYIMLPLPPGCVLDGLDDGTGIDSGWAVISGTSAAAPQLAGVCALLKERDPSLTPAQIKSFLRRSAIDVVNGEANAASNEWIAQSAGVGPDNATGMGLVDAFGAWSQI